MARQLKVALLGDTHADASSRFDEHNRIMFWIAEDAVKRGCELMLHSGDLYERKSTSVEREAVLDWARCVANAMPLVVVAGNHDDPLDIELLNRIAGVQAILGATRPEAIPLRGNLPVGQLHVVVQCFPWPRKGGLLAAAGDATHEQTDEDAVHALGAVLRHREQVHPDIPRIFLGHVNMKGSKTTHSQPPLVGTDLELSLDDLAQAECDLYALGHIHLEQQWEINGVPVVYPGAPRHCNWGELERKGYTVATFEGSKLVDLEFVETPCTRMVSLDYEWRGERFEQVTDGDYINAEVRLRYTVPVDQRGPAKKLAKKIAAMMTAGDSGALSVKIEERVIVQARARAPEVAKAVTVLDKLTSYWDSQKEAGPKPEARARMINQLGELEVAA